MRRLLIAALLLTGSAAAHGVWVAERTDRWAIIVGHGHEDVAYPPSRVEWVRGCGPQGPGGAVTLEPEPQQTFLKPESAGTPWIAISYEAPLWTKLSDGTWVERAKAPGETGTTSEFHKYAIAAVSPGTGVCEAGRFMIVPEVDPLSLAPDALLPVRVLWDGAPLVGVALAGDYVGRPGDVSATSDSQGRAAIPIRNQGLNVIAAKKTIKAEGKPGIDEEEYIATLSFILTYREEETHGSKSPAQAQ